MSSIQEFFQQTQLAEAAYADFRSPTGQLIIDNVGVSTALQAEGMSKTQGDTLASNWQVIDQFTATGLLGPNFSGTGFSATVFKNIDATSTDFGKYTLAIRGSTGINDFIADGKLIVRDGVAVDQLIDLYNYWQSLKTPQYFPY